LSFRATCPLCEPHAAGAKIDPEETIDAGNHVGLGAPRRQLSELIPVPHPYRERIRPCDDVADVVGLEKSALGAKIHDDEPTEVRPRTAVDKEQVATQTEEVFGIVVPQDDVSGETVSIATTGSGRPDEQI
jgi:hypothetical protein